MFCVWADNGGLFGQVMNPKNKDPKWMTDSEEKQGGGGGGGGGNGKGGGGGGGSGGNQNNDNNNSKPKGPSVPVSFSRLYPSCICKCVWADSSVLAQSSDLGELLWR